MPSQRAENSPTLAGRYRVIRQLGQGGMASVVLAEDERLGRLVAIKRLHTSGPEDALARFRREARIGASLNHPNVVSIFDSTTDEDSLLIVMEYVDGDSLKEELRTGALPVERTLALLTQIAAALDHAHASGVIHRDVKPSNVLIAGDGTAKLADLGIATAVDATRITGTNDIIGTLSYIAPERLEQAPDAPSADVYSLAAVAFEALSGQKAQRGRTPTEIVTTGEPLDLREAWPAAPAAAAEALAAGLARDPGSRPRSAGELIGRLATGLRGDPAPSLPDPEATAPLPIEPTPQAAAAPPLEPAATAPGRASGGWNRGRTLAAGALAAAVGAVIAIAAIGSGDEGANRAARVPTKTKSVATKGTEPTATTAEPVQLSGAARGAQLNDQGKALIDAGSYAEAIPVLQRAVDSFPDGSSDINYAYALFNLGNALRLAGQPEEAIPVLEQRLQIPNQQDVVAAELALAQQEAGVDSSGGTEPAKKEKAPKPEKPPKGGGIETDDQSSGGVEPD